jgi:hypothetical protein
MSEEKSVDKMAYVKVSHRNIERIKAVGKKGESFDDVVTKLLDYYEDLRRQECINTKNTKSDANRCKEKISG